ncbi:HlyD family secretion protein [Helicobacter sp. MIT 05-5293]|uniref:HlyD family secretion protein n=1 Tax=Helicobacter sp. MIT 05-5293 TaxID=1548149 RepID=UPI00051D659B|nr:efflux RND transporter periplasmic adaptor subunit [Helicobacter sp. MIT 05-5293]TLD80963.1 HlyD family secretion protein [Helicobacter sp. MIT 05-5293]
MKHFSIKIIALVFIALAFLLWLAVSFVRAYQPKDEKIYAQVEAREYAISSKVAGRIENIFVKKGDSIKKGDLIYSIDSPELQAKLEQAKAGYEAAKALSTEANQGARVETIQSAKDLWQGAKAMANLAKSTYDRIESLYKDGVISQQRRDEAYANYTTAKHNENVAYQQYKIALDGATNETKAAARAKEDAAAGQVNEVESYAKDTQAIAPANGEISNVLLHEGELAPSGFPVAMMIDMKDAWIRFSVPENRLKDFPKGQHFKAFIPALNTEAEFEITYVAAMGDFATWRATSANKGYDVKTFEVEAYPTTEIQGLRVGMSVLLK